MAGDDRAAERWLSPDLAHRDLTAVTIEDCVLRSPVLSGTILRAARVVASRVTDGFAESLLAARSAWRGVLLERLRIGSAELFDADLVSVHLRGCKVDDLDARSGRWTDVVLEDCIITTLDLAGARLERVTFARCRIGRLELSGTACQDVDLRSTSVERIDGLEGLRGVSIDPGQLIDLAPVLARHLGIRVE